MKNIVVFGASNSKNSINKQLAIYVAKQLTNVSLTVVDLNNYEMPIFSVDREAQDGIPQLAKDFNEEMLKADGFVVSFAEHNGAYATCFKNIFDWVSRINSKMWNNKPVLLLATSPGGRGAVTVLDIAAARMPFHGATVVGTFSLPFFDDNFKEGKIINNELLEQVKQLCVKFENEI